MQNHSKWRNTKIIRSLLESIIAQDIANNKKSKALPILKKFFTNKSQLSKELLIYNELEKFALNEGKEISEHSLVDALNEIRKKYNDIDHNKLIIQRKQLIGEMINTLGKDVFDSKISNYKYWASICVFLENSNEILAKRKATNMLLEYNAKNLQISSSNFSPKIKKLLNNKQDRKLLNVSLTEAIKDMYDNLGKHQQNAVKTYITNPDQFKSYVQGRVKVFCQESNTAQPLAKEFLAKIKDKKHIGKKELEILLKLEEVYNG